MLLKTGYFVFLGGGIRTALGMIRHVHTRHRHVTCIKFAMIHTREHSTHKQPCPSKRACDTQLKDRSLCITESFEYGIEDTPSAPLIEMADRIADQLDRVVRQEGRKALVHCAQGISRSPDGVIFYLIKYRGMDLYAARSIVGASRKQALPNHGFLRALQAWDWSKHPRILASPESKDQLANRRRSQCAALWRDNSNCLCSLCIASTLM
jgi:predicted protein tyrosine phosphatase